MNCGVEYKDYNEQIHAICGGCGIILLIETMSCPIPGDGLFCELCAEKKIATQNMQRKPKKIASAKVSARQKECSTRTSESRSLSVVGASN